MTEDTGGGYHFPHKGGTRMYLQNYWQDHGAIQYNIGYRFQHLPHKGGQVLHQERSNE